MLRHGMPYLWLKDCHVAALLAMTNLERFYLGNGRFCFMRPFCAVLPRIVFQTFRSGNCSVFDRFIPKTVPFSSKTDQICHCEERQRRGNLKRNDLPSRNEIWLDGTKQNPERKRKRNEAANPMFFVIGLPSCFPLPCFATGCHTFGLKIATAALRPRNDTNLKRFYLGNGRFCFMRPFCAVLPRIVFFKCFVPKTVPFFRKTYQICHCEER